MKHSPVCTHLFMMSSCFSLASSYLSAKRSAISRKLFLKGREKQFLTSDPHTGQARVWEKDKEGEEGSKPAGWECLHLAPVPHRAFSKPSFLRFDWIKDRLYSPLLSTVIQILQLFLFLSPQQLHSEVNTLKKIKIKIKPLATR